jgi:hypothetical protein
VNFTKDIRITEKHSCGNVFNKMTWDVRLLTGNEEAEKNLEEAPNSL